MRTQSNNHLIPKDEFDKTEIDLKEPTELLTKNMEIDSAKVQIDLLKQQTLQAQSQ